MVLAEEACCGRGTGQLPYLSKSLGSYLTNRYQLVKNSSQSFDIKGTAMFIRHREYETHHAIIAEGKSIPGRLTGLEISKFLEKYTYDINMFVD